MSKLKKIFTSWRVIMLILFLVFALVSIRPEFWNEGVSVRSIIPHSAASDAGMANPKANSAPLNKETITAIDNQPITSLADYYAHTASLKANQTVYIKTNKQIYPIVVKELKEITVLNETEWKEVEEIITANETVNGTVQAVNKTIKTTKEVPKTIEKVIGVEELGIKVSEAATTNIRKGLDLEGGTRVLLKPAGQYTLEDIDTTLESLKQRLNTYGLGDISVRKASDLGGNDFILVEVAGATEEEVKDLISKQGKFEAKVGEKTVFVGGQNDVSYVCRSAKCSGIDMQQGGCYQSASSQWGCNFFFTISLSGSAAQKQAEATSKLEVVAKEGGQGAYLSKTLDLYLDDKLMDSLQIGAELKGRATTDIQISGSSQGITQQEAVYNTLASMKNLQTILLTGSLPIKLEVVKIETLSPLLGKEMLFNALWVGALALLAVALIVYLRYRKPMVVIPLVLTLASEVILLLGFAALTGWNLDLAAIAGIIIAIGTGVDHLVIITDETVKQQAITDWKEKIKLAMFIITGAYLTVLSGMLPLWFIGAGTLKGFAFTTIAGLSFGVLIARPAYAAIVEILLKE